MHSDLNAQFIVQIVSTKDVIRSKNLGSKLIEMGLSFQISPGIVPSTFDFESGLLHSAFLSELICQRELRLGEVGCALAHRNALKNFLNSEREFGFIFEDDAEVVSRFNFDVVTNLLDSDFPIVVALGWIPGFAIAKNPQVCLGDDPVELSTSPTCTFAYALNRSAAKILVSDNKSIIDLADWPIYSLNKVKYYAISAHSPWVTANHSPEFSTIGERVNPTPSSPISVLTSRIRLLRSLITLLLLSKTKKLDVSPKQIVHRLLIRDLLYKHGTSQLNEESVGFNVIPISLKLKKLLELLKLN